MKVTRRSIQIALGLLWLLDGALQLQHQMFTSNFANRVLVPATQSQPPFVAGPTHLAIHVLLIHPAVFDAIFACTQLALGVLILWPRTVQLGLKSSVFWGLIVWYFGEGLGGLLSWQSTLLMGAPGAALIYVILALAVMRRHKTDDPEETQYPAYWLPIAWAILWVAGAIYQLLPGQNSTLELATMIKGMTSGAPSWLASLQNHTANLFQGKGFGAVAVLAAVQALIGLLVLFPGYARRIAISASVVLSLVFWLIGQGLGSYYSGLATDPNSGPLFVLMAVAILGVPKLHYRVLLRRATNRLEELFI